MLYTLVERIDKEISHETLRPSKRSSALSCFKAVLHGGDRPDYRGPQAATSEIADRSIVRRFYFKRRIPLE